MPRQHERVSVSLEIVFELASGKREARVSDLSRGGCFVDTIMDIAEGEEIVFQLKMPTGEWVKLSGKVAHRLPGFGFGISFTLPLTEEQRTPLYRIIFAHGGKLSGYTDQGHR
jgi:hypothetical protein